jgi:hypothetical protein
MKYYCILMRIPKSSDFKILKDEENESLLFISEDLSLNYIRTKILKEDVLRKLKMEDNGLILIYSDSWYGRVEHYELRIDSIEFDEK